MSIRGILLILLVLVVAALLGAVVLRIAAPERAGVPAVTSAPPALAGLAGDVRLTLTIDPARPGSNRYDVLALNADRKPLNPDAGVVLRFLELGEETEPATRALAPRGEGRYAAEGRELAAGWWELEVIVRRPGRPDASTFFPLRIGPPRSPRQDADAEQLLQDARTAIAEMRSWREMEQLTDGTDGLVITRTELLPPDRLHYVARYELPPATVGEIEVVIVGGDRYERRSDGPWKHETLRRPLVAEGYRVYMNAAEGITGGRRGMCGAEPCRIVLWMQAGGSPAFAAWIGLRTHLVHRQHMLSPSHYMTVRPVDVNAPVRISPPGP